jgi:Lrp/AsnC family leucine-responsive transcriptional regulator
VKYDSIEKTTMEIKLDDIDRAILNLLSANGKMGNKELASQVGLTITPTYERVRRLERDGIIKGYKATIDQKRIGKELHVHCHISLKNHFTD